MDDASRQTGGVVNLSLLWLQRIVATRWWRIVGAAAGVGLAAALIGTLGAFLTASFATMTDRAVAGVPVDWQVHVSQGGDPGAVAGALANGARTAHVERVTYADVAGFSASTGGTVQTTGPGQVVGIGETYRNVFPSEMRPLVGSATGVLLAQQTASNLRARIGDRVDVMLDAGASPAPGRASSTRRVSAVIEGIVDLPFADSFFQTAGAAHAQALQAPPDNVLIVPSRTFQRWFSAQAARRPSTVRTEFHVQLAHDLPHDPAAAFDVVTHAANIVELKSAGAAVVADNLAAQLQSTREDALYARLLFLFLGLPGAVLGVIVAIVVVRSGSERRRHDAALLRVRGATAADISTLAAVEAMAMWAIAILIAAVAGVLAARLVTRGDGFSASTALLWVGAGLVAAALIVALEHIVPSPAASTAAGDLKAIGRPPAASSRKIYLDLIVLGVGAAFFANTAAHGYQVVLAPEGVPQTAVSYDAFVGPLLLWLGGGMLVRHIAEMWLSNRRLLTGAYRTFAGGLAGIIAAAISRQRGNVGRGLTIVALAIAFAVSTAVFNETYNHQARADAELTNGADVAVVVPSGVDDSVIRDVRATSGIAGTDIMQHRFAYVGQDLQDLYAIDASRIGSATDMSDAFFGNHDARASLSRLAAQADGALLADETIKDFQLREGDRIKLRLQSARDGAYHPVSFTFIGAVREFPTAPRDSFIVANTAYVTNATGGSGTRIVLIRAGARDASTIADDIRSKFGGLAGVHVTDIATAQKTVGSSLTSVDLHGLTAVELAFALVLLIGASGLSLGLGFAERRRMFVILSALGATPKQVGSFLWAEAGTIIAGGLLGGAILGIAVAAVLVKVLTGVFDPPPEALAVPWPYLSVLVALAVVVTALVVLWNRLAADRSEVNRM
jgi:putative ABC transport system permease protein